MNNEELKKLKQLQPLYFIRMASGHFAKKHFNENQIFVGLPFTVYWVQNKKNASTFTKAESKQIEKFLNIDNLIPVK